MREWTVNGPLQLLAAAVSRAGGAGAVAMTDADWLSLAAAAARHGLTVAAAGAASRRPDAPAAVTDELRASAQAQRVSGLQGLAELLTVVPALDAAGVAVLALKGPAFSQWLYGDPGFRRFGDLDLLVAPEDRKRALSALQALGFQLPPGMSPKTADSIYGPMGAWPLSKAGTHAIDLHWRTAHARFPAPLTARELVERSTTIRIASTAVRIPSPTDAALLTLLHAAKHLWCSLELVASIARLEEREDVDWSAVRSLARRAHAWQGCAVGLQLASDILDAKVPVAVRADVSPRRASVLHDEALRALRLASGDGYDRWTERRVHRASFDRRLERWRYDVSRLLHPTPLDWQWHRLPDRLSGLYPPLRLARLATAGMRRRAS